ncbi:hypothetical protein TrLO_g10087 [Triparma laevis f. longispina]|uniref:RING-type E3 ubiquitin transferase n=1 Tax=Triparma laevis f. longispina TaxID=1714387 RepID=A0A9W7FFB5_9STRA|nr:hypothetical protein TrLO_g10087 [Triparma laevis f. longispina]
MLRAISPGRTILINLPGNTRAALIPPVILKYLSLFERAMQEGRRDILYVNVPLQHEDIRFLNSAGALVNRTERQAIINRIMALQAQNREVMRAPRQGGPPGGGVDPGFQTPVRTPAPAPAPAPVQFPALAPTPTPAQAPAPSPTAAPVPAPSPTAAPAPAPSPTAAPAPAPSPTTAPVPASVPAAAPPSTNNNNNNAPPTITVNFNGQTHSFTPPPGHNEVRLQLPQPNAVPAAPAAPTAAPQPTPEQNQPQPQTQQTVPTPLQQHLHRAFTQDQQRHQQHARAHSQAQAQAQAIQSNMRQTLNLPQLNPAAPTTLPPLVPTPAPVGEPVSSASAGSLQDFVCAVCLDYIQSPASATCNCNFCVECIHKWLETSTNTNCPTCRAPMASEDLKPNPAFFEKTDPVVTCPHKGCEKSLPLSKLKEHAKGCSFLPLKCKYSSFGCQHVSPSSEIAEHLSSCSFEAFKGLITKTRLQEMHIKQLSKNANLANNIIVQNSLHIQNLSDRVASLNNNMVNNPSDAFAYIRLYALSMTNPWGFNAKRQAWHDFLVNQEALALYNTVISILPVFILIAVLNLKGLYKLMYISDCFYQEVYGVVVALVPDEAARDTFRELKIDKCMDEKLDKIDYIIDSCGCLMSSIVALFTVRPKIIGTVLKRVGDGNNNEGFVIKCKMRDLISLALRVSVVCVVAERWLDVFDAIACVSAFNTACNKWFNMNWDFFIIKKEFGVLDNGYYLLMLARFILFGLLRLKIEWAEEMIKSTGLVIPESRYEYSLLIFLFFCFVNAMYSSISKTSMTIGIEMRKQILIANSPPQLGVYTQEQRANAMRGIHTLGTQCFGFFMVFVVVFIVSLVKC